MYFPYAALILEEMLNAAVEEQRQGTVAEQPFGRNVTVGECGVMFTKSQIRTSGAAAH